MEKLDQAGSKVAAVSHGLQHNLASEIFRPGINLLVHRSMALLEDTRLPGFPLAAEHSRRASGAQFLDERKAENTGPR